MKSVPAYPDKAYSIEQIRQKYPKAYMKWTEEDDRHLKKEYAKMISELARMFQRKPGAIRSRLKKLIYQKNCEKGTLPLEAIEHHGAGHSW